MSGFYKIVQYSSLGKRHDCVERNGKWFIICSRSLPTNRLVDGTKKQFPPIDFLIVSKIIRSCMSLSFHYFRCVLVVFSYFIFFLSVTLCCLLQTLY